MKADANNDNEITAGELHYMYRPVIQQSSGSQTPELQGDADRVLLPLSTLSMTLVTHTESLAMLRYLCDSFKCYTPSVTLYGRLKWLTAILPNLWS